MASGRRRHEERYGGLLLFPLIVLGVLQRTAPYHLGNVFIAEESRLRLFMLKRYARNGG